jgi:hypothetical protein
MTMRRLFITLAIALAIAIPVGKWHLAGAQTSGPQIMVDPSSFQAGSINSLTVTGTGFAPGEDLSVGYAATEGGGNGLTETAQPDPVTDSTGAFTTTLPVPSDIDSGTWSVYAIGAANPSSPDFTTAPFEVTSAGGSTDTPTAVTSDTPTDTPTVAATGTTTVTTTPTNTSTPTVTTVPGSTKTPTGTAAPTNTSTPTATTIPGSTQTPTSTATSTSTVVPSVISSPSVTPAPTSTVTPAPTDTSTSVPASQITFSVEAVKIGYGSANPANVFHKASLAHVKIGEKVKLILFALLMGIQTSESVTISFRVTSAGKTDLFARGTRTISPSENGQNLGWSHFFTPKKRGDYTFAGTIFVGSHHRHKSVNFAVR